MADDDILERYANLKLDDEDGGVVDLGGVDIMPSKEKFHLLLIGRLVTDRPYNVEAFKNTMTTTWCLRNKLIIRVLGPNLYAFQFFHWRDKERVLNGRPWCFDNKLIVMKEVEGDEQPDQVSLYHSPFWVRIKNLPFNCRTDDDVKEIVANWGEVMEVEEDILGLDRFRRVKLMINITKPLRRFQRILDKGRKTVCVEFAFERLPFFCFACGVIGHSEKDCDMVSEDSKKAKLGRGRWLRASPRKGRLKDVEKLDAVISARKQLFVTKDMEKVEVVSDESEEELNMDKGTLQLGNTSINSSDLNLIVEGNDAGENIGEVDTGDMSGGGSGEVSKLSGTIGECKKGNKKWRKKVRQGDSNDVHMSGVQSDALGKRVREVDKVGEEKGFNSNSDDMTDDDISGWRVAEAVFKQPRLAQ
ncbi:uncharacterized protein LOC110713404 [Chenopodium quinoa]|uniref:uncharacterized protein LOC110713404 n=1 Tax=Chenopodium quinoa TaxID=63459 RepID=UPI000B77C955|nr:uncharacterized protein LOC110713404 [Chenopodium quinoa]